MVDDPETPGTPQSGVANAASGIGAPVPGQLPADRKEPQTVHPLLKSFRRRMLWQIRFSRNVRFAFMSAIVLALGYLGYLSL